ncbi:MAG: response regulator [Deltaproteobacteria bacterium]|nr:response regulator [Deltaproteobacteria bacterium]
MRTLIVEDDFSSRLLLEEMLGQFGPVHQAMNGLEAVEAYRLSLESGNYYDLVCLDIMLPKMNGQDVLLNIRNMEKTAATENEKISRVVMITVMRDTKNIISAFKGQCDGYLIKPFDQSRLMDTLRQLRLIEA